GINHDVVLANQCIAGERDIKRERRDAVGGQLSAEDPYTGDGQQVLGKPTVEKQCVASRDDCHDSSVLSESSRTTNAVESLGEGPRRISFVYGDALFLKLCN